MGLVILDLDEFTAFELVPDILFDLFPIIIAGVGTCT